MDFITGLPSIQGKSCIMVVVDRLTKAAHFCALAAGFSSEKVAAMFVREVIRLHGVPLSIVSDHDSCFVAHFWQSLQRAMGTTSHFSTTFYPQTDG